jgi:GNAT superfamily N-acetyltransferase
VGPPFQADELRVVPATEATCEELTRVLAGDAARCRCQRFKVQGWIWRDSTQEQRDAAFEEQTGCGRPDVTTTSGLVAYAGDEPVGWVAVEPRPAYPKLRTSRVPWTGRNEDRGDEGVWAVTCFVVRKGYRGRGVTYALARATVPHARQRGARAVEGYPMVVPPGKVVTWGELHVGARQVFEEAGFVQVSAPTLRRVVMRVELVPA